MSWTEQKGAEQNRVGKPEWRGTIPAEGHAVAVGEIKHHSVKGDPQDQPKLDEAFRQPQAGVEEAGPSYRVLGNGGHIESQASVTGTRVGLRSPGLQFTGGFGLTIYSNLFFARQTHDTGRATYLLQCVHNASPGL